MNDSQFFRKYADMIVESEKPVKEDALDNEEETYYQDQQRKKNKLPAKKDTFGNSIPGTGKDDDEDYEDDDGDDYRL